MQIRQSVLQSLRRIFKILWRIFFTYSCLWIFKYEIHSWKFIIFKLYFSDKNYEMYLYISHQLLSDLTSRFAKLLISLPFREIFLPEKNFLNILNMYKHNLKKIKKIDSYFVFQRNLENNSFLVF